MFCAPTITSVVKLIQVLIQVSSRLTCGPTKRRPESRATVRSILGHTGTSVPSIENISNRSLEKNYQSLPPHSVETPSPFSRYNAFHHQEQELTSLCLVSLFSPQRPIYYEPSCCVKSILTTVYAHRGGRSMVKYLAERN